MHYLMTDSEGNVLDTFVDDVTARSALRTVVNNSPGAIDDVLLVPYNDDGSPAGEAVMFRDITADVVSLAMDLAFTHSIRSYVYETVTPVYTQTIKKTSGPIMFKWSEGTGSGHRIYDTVDEPTDEVQVVG